MSEYSDRLRRLESVWWKRLLDVQRPYRWHARSLGLGFVLDVGCGIGRNLGHLRGKGVGIDLDPGAIAQCRARDLKAFLPDEFKASEYAAPGRFDGLLCAHVLEHMASDKAVALLGTYLPYVREGGRVVLITPQEAGYESDSTHVQFCGFGELQTIADKLGIQVERTYSFPLPRRAGRFFKYNEFVLTGRIGGRPLD